MSLCFEKKSLQPLKFLKNLQAIFKEVHRQKVEIIRWLSSLDATFVASTETKETKQKAIE